MFLFNNPLKKIWKALQQPHDWMNPAPEVQKKLEEKGYHFEFNNRSYGHMIMRSCDVTAPNGKKTVSYGGAYGRETECYKQDYEKAVEECRNSLRYF